MRNGNTSIDSIGVGGVGSVDGTGAEARSSTAASAARTDSVSLSSAANLVALAKTSDTSRQAKIESLGAEIKSGAYQADNAQVSHALVDGHITS